MNLTHLFWPRQWQPSDDAINGDPAGLLRMDNLQQEEDGTLAIVRGTKQLAMFSDYVSDIYSTNLGSSNPIYVGLNIDGRQVIRSKNGQFTDNVTVVDSGAGRAIFSSCLGQVNIICGTQRKKDDGTTVRNLGITDPIPGIIVNTNIQPELDLSAAGSGTYSVIEGTVIVNTPPSIQLYVDDSTLRGVARYTFGAKVDTTAFPDGVSDDIQQDQFSILVQLHDSNLFESIRVEFVLDTDPTLPQNYYHFEWDINDGQFNLGINQQSFITATRGQFQREGIDSQLDWKHVTAMNVVAIALSRTWYLVGPQKFTGGAKGQLNGLYEYARMDVRNNGIYQAKSILQPNNFVNYVVNGFTTVIAGGADPQVNEVWIFRRSVTVATSNEKWREFVFDRPNLPQLLDRWYRVGVIQGNSGQIDDKMSDTAAIALNITANLFLQSVQNITGFIIGMEGLFNERMLYVTTDSIYLSDRLNPDAVDTRYTIRAFGDPTEKNLWLKKISNDVMILATTKEHYEITGTLLDLPDGTLDVRIIPIGEKYPSLSADFAYVSGGIFYPAADGIRATNGSNSQLISQPLRLLWQGEDRHGVPGVAVLSNNNARYCMAVGKTKLYVGVPMTDGTRRLFVYDLVKQVWRLQYTDPIALGTTPTDRVLAGYNDPSEGLWELEVGTGVQAIAGTQGFPFTFQTVYDSNGQPRNRKDTFTLKIVSDCGGSQVDIYVAKDGGTFTFLGFMNHSGLATRDFDISTYTLGFRYAVRLVDHATVTSFHLYEMTVEYEARPEQRDYLRILGSNFGTMARKRVPSYGIIIDTLGNNITFLPYIDNIAWPLSDTVNTNSKLTYIFYFTSEALGTEFGGILSGGLFEFYETATPKNIEELPPRTKWFRIPNNNLGVAAPKRVRTLPIVIDTAGKDVIFTPIVDGVLQTVTTILNSSRKATLYHFFDTDVFGTDFGGILQATTTTPYEFYELGNPEDVEVLPVPKKYDQLGPIRFDKIGKLFGFRARLIMNGSTVLMPFTIYGDLSSSAPTYATPLYSGSFTVVPQIDEVYEILLPKSVNTDVIRLSLGPTVDTFHRYDVLIKAQSSGMESESQWMPIR